MPTRADRPRAAWSFHWPGRARLALWVGFWAALTAALAAVDGDVAARTDAFMRDTFGSRGVLPDALSKAMECYGQAPGVLAVAAVSWLRTRRTACAICVLLVAVVVGATNGAAKLATGRERPEQAMNVHGSYRPDFGGPAAGIAHQTHRSFPSGHTATAAANTTVLAVFWPAALPAGVALTGAVIAQRILHLKHYPADTSAAVLLGSLVAAWLLASARFQRLCLRGEQLVAAARGALRVPGTRRLS